jgi:hypothetical protein
MIMQSFLPCGDPSCPGDQDINTHVHTRA